MGMLGHKSKQPFPVKAPWPVAAREFLLRNQYANQDKISLTRMMSDLTDGMRASALFFEDQPQHVKADFDAGLKLLSGFLPAAFDPDAQKAAMQEVSVVIKYST